MQFFSKPAPSAPLSLRRSSTPPDAEPVDAVASAAPPRGLVLLVDDSPMVRTIAAKTLKAQNFTVIQADSGVRGLEEWEKQKSEVILVVSDVFMPLMDGLSFGRELRRRGAKVPIILMSSKLDEDSRWIAEEEGFRLLPKPFTEGELVALVDRLLRTNPGA